MLNKLEFDNENHIYRLDGSIIPGYSQIARDLGLIDYSRVRQSDLNWKAEVGKAVHTAIFLNNTGELDLGSLDEVVNSYFKSWLMFVELYQPKILTQYSEKPICSVKWRYGVTPDIIAEIKYLTDLEIKTVTSMNPVTALQTEAQKIAIEETYNLKIKQRWGLQLIPNAMPKLEVYTDTSDYSAWLSCVNVWHYKERTKLWKR
jgi:hypothetical protein